jgi:DNA-binding transcriptional ArsR family regulator
MASNDRCEVRYIDEERVGKARATLLDDEVYADLAETFRAVADSNRAKMVYCLQQGELCVCDLAAVVGLSESAVSQHLRVLRALRLVRSRKEGKMVYYSINDDHVNALLEVCLQHVRHE